MPGSAHTTTSASAGHPFGWRVYDARQWLPEGWQEDILGVADSPLAAYHALTAEGTVASREEPGTVIPTWTVDGTVIAGKLPWITDLYRGMFLTLAQIAFASGDVVTSADRNYGCNINVMRGCKRHGHNRCECNRYECHVDTGLQSLLFASSMDGTMGGELVVANRGDVRGVAAVDEDPTIIRPVAGQIIFFDARRHTHYVRALADPYGVRSVVSMAYYHPWLAPESAVPDDLKDHLYEAAG